MGSIVTSQPPEVHRAGPYLDPMIRKRVFGPTDVQSLRSDLPTLATILDLQRLVNMLLGVP